MRQLALLICALTISGATYAAPLVSEALLEDQLIKISGKSFGTDNPMLFWDDVEPEPSQLGRVVEISAQTRWKANTSKWGAPFTYAISEGGKAPQEKYSYYGEGHKNFLGSPKHAQPEEIKNQLFVSWWYKPSLHPHSEGGSNKFIRVWDSSDGHGTRISWTQMHFTCGEVATWGQWNGDVGKWNHHAIYIDLKNENVKTWVNGALVHDGKCNKSSEHKNLPLYVGLIGFDHGSNAYKSMTTSIEDIYIGKSQARVEISNSERWSSVMLKEILPIESWSDNEIIAKTFNSKVGLSSNTYVYVIDKDGNVNKYGAKLDCRQCPVMQPN